MHTLTNINLPNIANTLLLPHERTVRIPLERWLDWIESTLSTLSPSEITQRHIEVLPVCYNLTALVHDSSGQHKLAKQICLQLMHWSMIAYEKTRLPSAIVVCFQPWVNINRSTYLTGNYQSSLENYQKLRQEVVSGAINLGQFKLSACQVAEVKQAHPEAIEFLSSVIMIDSLKALIHNQRYDEILCFSSLFEETEDLIAKNFLGEAKIIAYSRLEQMELAVRQVHECLKRKIAIHRTVFGLRLIEIMIQMQEHQQAKKLISGLHTPELGDLSDGNVQVYNKRYVELLAILGKTEQAVRNAQLGLEAARNINDEPLIAGYLKVLCTLNCSNPWSEQLESLKRLTHYAYLNGQEARLDVPFMSRCQNLRRHLNKYVT